MENISTVNLMVENRAKADSPDLPPDNQYVPAVTTVMRIIGVIFIMGASLMFMTDRWSYWSHLARYGTFLSFTLLVGGCGLICGLRLHDPKGARTLLALSTALLPVLFAQLGALLFSCFPEANQYKYAEMYKWVAPGLYETIGTAGLSLLLLIPLTALSFSTLVKKAKNETTILYTALSLILLIPMRSDTFVFIATLIALGAYAWYERCVVSNETGFRTFEGTIIRLILWWPICIFAGRNIMLYHITIDSLVPALNFTCIGLAVLTLGVRLELPQWVHLCIDFTGWVLCSIAVGLFLDLPFIPTRILFGQESTAGIGIGILIVTSYLQPLLKRGSKELQAVSWIVASLLCLHDVLYIDTIMADLTCVMLGFYVMRPSAKNPAPHYGIGAAMALTGCLSFCYDSILWLNLGSWPIYALAGLGTIIASSFIERANRRTVIEGYNSIATEQLHNE